MSAEVVFSPTRRVTKPILSDEAVLDVEAAESVFYTPRAQWLQRHIELLTAAMAGGCLLIAWLIRLTAGPQPLGNLFVLLAFATAGLPALEAVWKKLRTLRIDVDLLMLLGAGLAAYVGSPFEGALLLFLFALSGGLESYALRRTQSAIVALRDLVPTRAVVLEGGETRTVPLRQVPVGATILVRPGEKVALDGVVGEGESSLDESAITGESIPRECREGDQVFAGTQNLDGRLVVRVSKLATDTTLARIVQLVTEAKQHPAAVQRLIDRIGPTYSLIVIGGSVLVGLLAGPLLGLAGREAVMRAIAVLIVASPCALIIATPVAYLAAMASAARRGVLIKGGAHLEVLARSGTVAFDKTGTLTTGKVRLVAIDGRNGLDDDEVLRYAGAIEASSTHPLAGAVNQAVRERGVVPPAVREYCNVPGEGTCARVEGRRVWIGRPESLSRDSAAGDADDLPARVTRYRQEGKTVSALTVDDAAALLVFQDTLREDAADCVAQLRCQGIRKLVMLTGDHELVARQVATRLGLDECRWSLAPHEKVTATAELRQQFGTLVLVGDGINDAPALADADVGIAMGAMGAEVALEAADIVVMKDRIERVAWLHRHARRTARIVQQNVTVALAVIGVLSVFAVLGHIPLPLAVIGHEGSTVAVALNALRLLGRGSR